MGVGAPDSLIDGVIRGVDMFDCVLPTRIARNGTCMTSQDVWLSKMPSLLRTLRHWILSVIATHVRTIHAPTFVTCSRLMKPLVFRLTSYHNLYFLLNLMKQVRQAIMDDNLLEFREYFVEKYGYNKSGRNF